ncbi:SdpA family antimicrobial peptide system protein [Streptomyces sp. AK02-01A]|uniref:SdpA family antimicrobial peptide system protein n=1 Tax=Streptomyces sp. AK02-01A TaxID=3028648 RepID=UPI0029AF5F4D|nr:SdpA family antimicrobial peptide system protein [Streptomyces sp. AK02-01A]MDX3853407.1 SdpA family antimicrobial peptide system protein [Streptomyces sp. AK02-01A]
MKRFLNDWRERLPLRTDQRLTMDVPRKLVWAAVAVCVILSLYVAQVHLPRNVLTLPGQQAVTPVANSVAAQGWAFFTKSPRDPALIPYIQRGGVWRNELLAPHSEPRNAFGFDRRSRSQGIEIAMLSLEAPKEAKWKECSGDLPTCLASAHVPVATSNRSPEPSLCGRVALVQEAPTPFAWRDLRAEKLIPKSVLALEVAC